MAWLFTRSPARRASSRRGISSSSSAGRMPRSRAKAAPFGARRSSSVAPVRRRFSGSIWKVRMTVGYRLRKSSTATLCVQARDGLHDVTARLRLARRLARADARRDDAAAAQLGQVAEVEGGDRRADPVERHAREQAALHRQLQHAQPLQDLERETCVGAVVLDEPGAVLAVQPEHLEGALAARQARAVDRLALAQHRPRDRVEPVVLHADEGAAQQPDAVEHHPPRDRRLLLAARSAICPQAQAARPASELQGDADAPGDAQQHRQVEVDHVPAGEDVRIRGAHAPARTPGAARARWRTPPRRGAARRQAARAAAPGTLRTRAARSTGGAVPGGRSRCRSRARAAPATTRRDRPRGRRTRRRPPSSRGVPSIAREPRTPRSMR